MKMYLEASEMVLNLFKFKGDILIYKKMLVVIFNFSPFVPMKKPHYVITT